MRLNIFIEFLKVREKASWYPAFFAQQEKDFC
jgi:hypothetical protein